MRVDLEHENALAAQAAGTGCIEAIEAGTKDDAVVCGSVFCHDVTSRSS